MEKYVNGYTVKYLDTGKCRNLTFIFYLLILELKKQVTINPLLSPPGGLFISSAFEVGLNREGGLI